MEKYNDNIVSKDLINYILQQSKFINKKDKIKIVINKTFDKSVVNIIKQGLTDEYLLTLKKRNINNIEQIIFLILGIFCLFFSATIDMAIFKEIVLIGGWVLIWETIELELFSDSQIKRNKMILKKLLKSDFVEKKD